ncbi:MAG: hypothetical protein J6W60_03420, partial [Treponema sp.]|nr:hypothetical protein [Treponema sp.]
SNLAQTVRSQELVVKNAREEQTEGNKQVLEAIRSINDSTVRVKESSAEMLEGANQVVEEMGILSEVTKKTTESMQVINTNLEAISASVKEVQTSSDQNQRDTESRAQKLGTFKV